MAEIYPWKDDVMTGFEKISEFFSFVLRERSQLYGSLIHLMILTGSYKVELPPTPEKFVEYGRKYYVMFSQGDDGKFYMEVHKRENEEKILD
jgi:hypothetical protein